MKHCPQCSTGYPDTLAACPTHGLPLNEIRDLKPGMVVHHSYRIVRKLGQGGMGAVYLAQHTLMDEPRALKFLSAELSQDQAFTARFLREVRTLRQIRHPNVVDCGDLESAEDGSLFFSMEFVDGPDLRAFLRDAPQPFDVPLALDLTRQIAQGLAAAHARGMVHRDIKPENILLARDGSGWQPKIADFGIVATKESSSVFTRTGGTLLTVAYAAPEQWCGTAAAELDGRTDLYALGGVLYEMLTGQTPFHAENYEGWARQHQTTPPPPPSALRPDLANWQGLDALVQRLLAKDREDRPKDVAELSGLLDEVRYVSRYARMETVNEANNHFQGSDLFSKQHKISSRLAVSVLAIGVVFMIAFVVWAIATQQSGKPTNMTAQTQPVVQPQMQTNADTIQVPKGLTPNPPVHVPKGFTLIEPAGDEQKAEALYKQKNYSDARIHFESACNDGQMKACSYLGYFYAQGLGGARDTQKAQDVYQKACSQGNMSSCASLGSIFQDAGNSNEASKYFQIACNGGMVKACDLLRGVQ